MEMKVTVRGLLVERVELPEVAWVAPAIEWLTDRMMVIAGGGNVILKGIVRGDWAINGGMVTVIAPSMEYIESELVLEEWIYTVREA